MPLPGRLPNYRDFTVMLLPSNTTKAMVHHLCQEAAEEERYASVSYSKFNQLWLELCPEISVITENGLQRSVYFVNSNLQCT